LAIYNNIFATRLIDIEKIYQIEIQSYINDVKLEMKKTKLNQLIFRRPEYLINQFRNSITILKIIYGEIGENAIIQYHDNESYI
jgi:hypothetical protein